MIFKSSIYNSNVLLLHMHSYTVCPSPFHTSTSVIAVTRALCPPESPEIRNAWVVHVHVQAILWIIQILKTQDQFESSSFLSSFCGCLFALYLKRWRWRKRDIVGGCTHSLLDLQVILCDSLCRYWHSDTRICPPSYSGKAFSWVC